MTSSTASTAAVDGADRLPASGLEAGADADLRRDPLPGAGHADRAGAGRLHARRRRPAAPRDGQEEAPRRWRKQRSMFVDGARRARRAAGALAAHIFDLMEKFAGYGFNKSHSAAYALLSYQTAYLKAHYPAAFMAAVLSADMDHTDKVVTLIEECTRHRPDGACRRMSTPRATRSPSATSAPSATAWARCKGVGRGRGRGADRASARRAARIASLEDLCRRARSAEGQPPRARGADPLRQPRRPRRRTAPR